MGGGGRIDKSKVLEAAYSRISGGSRVTRS